MSNVKVNNVMLLLAPKFGKAVLAAITGCRQAGPDAIIYEGLRSAELQALYHARGRTIIPPTRTDTNAPTPFYSWHGYGLAVDAVHRTDYWDPPGGEDWFRSVAAIFKRNDSSWGGDWTKPDTPHFQWHRCKPSPSQLARDTRHRSGNEAVWDLLRAR